MTPKIAQALSISYFWISCHSVTASAEFGSAARSLAMAASKPASFGSQVLPVEPGGHFDVGHRRSSVVRIGYASSQSDSKQGTLSVRLDELGITISSAGPLRRLTVLYTKSPTRPVWYAVCLCIG